MKTILGKINLRWCLNCNVPVVGKKCGICGNKTSEVKITPPGDVRIGFPKDIEMINNILKEQFGVKDNNIFKNKIVLINKIPGTDFMKEIIIDGKVFGILKYDEIGKEWKILPSVEGGRRIIGNGGYKKIVAIKKDVVPYILNKHASVLRPGITFLSESIKKGDEVIIVVDNLDSTNKSNPSNNFRPNDVIGVGKCRMDYEEVINITRGMVVKVRQKEDMGDIQYLPETGNFEESINKLIKANYDIIKNRERQAIGFIRNTLNKINKPPVVAYSGGKDSLVVLLLTMKSLGEEGIDFDVIFTDTTIEFDETIKNIKDISEKYGIDITIAKSKDFWNLVEKYGPPGRDYRWCSELCKMKPLESITNKKYPNGFLTFVGLRKYESFNRSKKPRIWQSPNIKNQILSAPILDWNALEVWIYLFMNNAPYNTLYERCFDRVGCYICPAMELGEIEIVKKQYPNLWKRWENFLKDYAKKNNLDSDWINGGWRWKYKNKKIKKISNKNIK